jgi:hypothetical protein
VQTTGRQLGSALGIAVLVAVLDTGAGAGLDFHGAWELMIAAALAAGVTLVGIGGRGRSAPAAVKPAEAAA